MIRDEWDRRIRRATELSSSYPFAGEGLNFYARVASIQRSLYEDFLKASAPSRNVSGTQSLREELDLFVLLPKFPAFLRAVGQFAPAPLAESAGVLAKNGSEAWQRAIRDFWQTPAESAEGAKSGERDHSDDSSKISPSENLLSWIFLQPYAEHLAARRAPSSLNGTPSACPLCGGKPIVGVLRGEGDGAKKSLICMLCAHEWTFRRIYCPSCGEEREPQMAYYSASEIPHVRVDVCDTCHTYLKSVDLTKTGLAVPVVDELATIPLDLWAREHGYEKLQTNMLGM